MKIFENNSDRCAPMWRILIFGIAVFASGCGSDKVASAQQKSDNALANTPEAVVRQWQAFVDANRAEEAKMLSTERTKKFIDDSPKIPNEEIVETIFSNMKCREMGDRAVCVYYTTTSSDTLKILDSLDVVRENGQWKVDIIESGDEEDAEIFDDHDQSASESASEKKQK